MSETVWDSRGASLCPMAHNLAMFEGPHRNRNIMIIVAVVVIAAVIVLYLTDRLPGIAGGTFALAAA
jgi:hypothetical protein